MLAHGRWALAPDQSMIGCVRAAQVWLVPATYRKHSSSNLKAIIDDHETFVFWVVKFSALEIEGFHGIKAKALG